MDREIKLGEILRSARIKREYTQEEIGLELGVSRQSISNWETGKTYPDIISIIKLSDIYNISLDTLLKGDDNVVKYLKEEKGLIERNKKIIIAFVILFILMMSILVLEIFNMINTKALFGLFTIAFLIGLYISWAVIDRI